MKQADFYEVIHMRIEVAASSVDAVLYDMKDTVAVVIDVLRATTVITTALENGAAACYPVTEVEEAKTLADAMKAEHPGRKVLLSGERGALLIPGFDLANSPLEFTPDIVTDAHIAMTTSNGTRALVVARAAEKVYVACLRNAAAVANAIKHYEKVLLVCSGTADHADISDSMAAAVIIHELINLGIPLQMGDLAMMCHSFYDPDTFEQRIRNSFHGQRLLALGLEDDLDYCCKVNVSNIVATYDGSRVK